MQVKKLFIQKEKRFFHWTKVWLLIFLCDVSMIYESELNDKLIIDLFNIICTKYGIYIMTGFTFMEILRHIFLMRITELVLVMWVFKSPI